MAAAAAAGNGNAGEQLPPVSTPRQLFTGLSFGVERGEIVLVRGKSGVGKSKLLRLLGGLDPINEEGDVSIVRAVNFAEAT